MLNLRNAELDQMLLILYLDGRGSVMDQRERERLQPLVVAEENVPPEMHIAWVDKYGVLLRLETLFSMEIL